MNVTNRRIEKNLDPSSAIIPKQFKILMEQDYLRKTHCLQTLGLNQQVPIGSHLCMRLLHWQLRKWIVHLSSVPPPPWMEAANYQCVAKTCPVPSEAHDLLMINYSVGIKSAVPPQTPASYVQKSLASLKSGKGTVFLDLSYACDTIPPFLRIVNCSPVFLRTSSPFRHKPFQIFARIVFVVTQFIRSMPNFYAHGIY